MARKRNLFLGLVAIALLVLAGAAIFFWMRFATGTASVLPDPLAVRMAPTDPCGCTPGSSGDTDIPLGLAKTKSIVDDYLKNFNDANLALKEIIVYNNNSYARIADRVTGINAMELFVDTETSIVISEYGTNFHWNLGYPSIPDSKTIGYSGLVPPGPRTDNIPNLLSISSQQAEVIAREYLQQYRINARLSSNVDVFYGYYVMEYMKWGKVLGMISINGNTGEAFRHDWHQTFIARRTY